MPTNFCRQCGADLTQAAASLRNCPKCGVVVSGSSTVDDARIDGTIDFGSSPTPPAAPKAAEPPEEAKPGTVYPLPHMKTAEFSLEVTASMDMGLPIDDDVPLKETKSETPQQLQPPAAPQPPKEEKPGTVYPLPHMQTAEFSLEGTASMDMGLPIDDDAPLKETKSDPLPQPSQKKGSGTEYPLPHLRTAEFSLESSASMDMGLPIDDGDKPPPGSSTKQSAVLRTFDSDAPGGGLIDRLSVAWGGQIDDGANPNVTIKGKQAGGQKNDQTLVVNTRAVRDPRTPKVMPTLADYELLELLGEGGMGVVYTARQASIDRTVAVKMLKPHLSRSKDSQQKFLSEAVVTGDLDHPNIVPMYDLGKNESGDLFYAMKKVEGTPWSKVIGKKSQPENVEILLKCCDAVAFAHARGVVHRDLKPENVMLGDFGEVLVMDWGLAYSTADFRKAASITHTHGMGGSPAYMAPEMATGPVERISAASDIYLLGAILYEIVTGKPPHSGVNVTQCLMSAARNDILPTEKTGELVDIARRAMATDMSARYPTVQAFQVAIREYLAHSESIALSARAEQELARARESSDYQVFARAVFGFEEALSLWSANTAAAEGLLVSKSAYARCAFDKGDFDLAAGLLDANRSEDRALLDQIEAALREREARKQRLRNAKRFAAALVVGIFVVGSVAYYGIQLQRDRALRAEEQALRDRDLAEESRVAAEAAREAAETSRIAAEKSRELAEKNRLAAEASKEAEEYAAYGARIGLAAARIDENAFDGASELLDNCPEKFRNWEWGRLKYLCDRSALTIDAEFPVATVAFDATGKRCASGGWNGKLRIWNVADGALLVDIPYSGAFVNAVAFSPDGGRLAAGGSDKQAYLTLFNAADGKPIRTFAGHADAVLSLVFNKQGDRLLSTSYDGTARIWDVESGKELKRFRGHDSWVWSADFSPDEKMIVTSGQDGTAVVWPLDAASSTDPTGAVRPFLGHRGPVHKVAYSSDGQFVASGGDDKRVLVWKPSDVRPYRLSEVFAEQTPPETPFRELLGHQAAVIDVAFSPDGKRLVSGGLDNALIVWDVAEGRALKTMRGHAGQVRSCRFSPDGRFVLSGAHDGTIRLWNVDAYEETRTVKPITLTGHTDAVLAADFSADELTIATAGRDKTARLWDVRTRKPTATLAEGHEYLASNLIVTPDGKRLITSAVDGSTRVWDLAKGVEKLHLPETGRNAALALSNDGKLILTGDGGKSAKLWDAETGKLLRTLPAHRTEITAVAISPDSRQLFTGEGSGRANIWPVDDGPVVWSELHHSRRITGAAFTRDGKQLLTASHDNSVGRWDVASGRELTEFVWKHPTGVLQVALVGDDRAVTTCEDGEIRLWRIAETSPQAEAVPLANGTFGFVAVSNDGKLLAAADHAAHSVRLWDLSAKRERRATPNGEAQSPWLDLASARDPLWGVAFAPDGQSIVTIGGSEARAWKTADAKELQSFRPHGAVAGVAFSPDGKSVATAGWDDSVKIWSTADAHAVKKIRGGHNGIVNGVAYDRNGRRLLTAGDDGTARLWDAATGDELKVFRGHTARVTHAAFSDDNRRIVTSSADKTARVWNTDDASLVAELKGHDWGVLWAEFSHDGKYVVTAAADNVAVLWDAETGKEIRSFAGHTAPVGCVAFSPDDQRIVTGSNDKNVKVWDAVIGKELLTLRGHADEVTVVRFSKSGRSILSAGRDGGAMLWPTIDWQSPSAAPTN